MPSYLWELPAAVPRLVSRRITVPRFAVPAASPLLVAAGILGGCSGTGESAPPEAGAEAVQEALAVAEEYVVGFYDQYPEEAPEAGYPDAPLDRLGDKSLEAIQGWQAREDAWLARLRAIDPADLEGTPAAVPYAYARERLEASVERRVCRTDLWNASPTWTGWQFLLPSVFQHQPVGTEELRAAALARARDVPRYLDVEIANLREGVRLGYTAPGSNVEAVLRQVEDLLELAPGESPFFDPARRDSAPGFEVELRRVIAEEIEPAIRRYRDFLADEYRSAAREAIGVTANPDGHDCYLASVRYWVSLPLTPEEIHRNGLRQMERIQAEMRAIGARSFGTGDTRELLAKVRTDPRYTFRTADEVLAYARAAVERGKKAVPDWFGFVPQADVVVKPYPAFQKRSGGGFYSAGVEGQPGTYQLGTYEPEKISRAGMEATAFHEAYPGHHLQVSVVLERAGVHPVLRYFFNSGVGEGWALYTERLADEMGLYSSDLDRLGMLSNEALRAARLVVDPGMHVFGWTRQQAIDYLLENTAESVNSATSEIDRYIAVPGQATAYLTGSSEIRRLRALAEERLGERFDIKAFHDRVLEDGTVTLGMLRDKIEHWVEEQAG
ncbi:MAG: DUF885 family protein [Gemmatimonadota bacterium]